MAYRIDSDREMVNTLKISVYDSESSNTQSTQKTPGIRDSANIGRYSTRNINEAIFSTNGKDFIGFTCVIIHRFIAKITRNLRNLFHPSYNGHKMPDMQLDHCRIAHGKASS